MLVQSVFIRIKIEFVKTLFPSMKLIGTDEIVREKFNSVFTSNSFLSIKIVPIFINIFANR